MEVTNIIINISISLVVGGGTGFCAFKWLGQKWVNNWFAKDLEKYKQQLDLLKMQKQLQYSNIYIQRAEVIRNLYKQMMKLISVKMSIDVANFKDDESKNKIYEEYAHYLYDFYTYCIENGIYLPDETYDKLIIVTDSLGKTITPKLKDIDKAITSEIIEALNNIPDYDLTAISKSLKTDFRSLLGIE